MITALVLLPFLLYLSWISRKSPNLKVILAVNTGIFLLPIILNDEGAMAAIILTFFWFCWLIMKDVQGGKLKFWKGIGISAAFFLVMVMIGESTGKMFSIYYLIGYLPILIFPFYCLLYRSENKED
ncbi:MAG: hypothetical protein HUJ25_04750 [Crocinitomicaceae bacterium]|nr:hypothetical protein [Crocinitomicaceae bacterium]